MHKILFIICLIMIFMSGCTGKNMQPADTPAAAADTVTEPAAKEQQGENGITNPLFSHEGGLYKDSISLELSAPSDAPDTYVIRYTVNGDEPRKNSEKYSGPIILLANRDSTTVRAACFTPDGKIAGNIITNTYIKDAGGRYSNIIVAISSDESYLNGREGIIANPTMTGKVWERPAHVEIFDTDGSRIIDQDAGLRIFGGSSRVLPQKSFRLVARKTAHFNDIRYNGEGSFDFALFEQRLPLAVFDRLVLRNGGNDSLQATAADPLRMNLLRDGIANNFAISVAPAVTAQASKPAVVFLNGDYYGILDLKEDINSDGIRNFYGIEDKNKITVIKSELDTTRRCKEHSNGSQCRFCDVWFFYEVDEGANSELVEFLSLCRRAIDSPSPVRAEVYKEIEKNIDLENFIQYTALNLFVCNTDWPHNNVRLWRYTGEYDLDIPQSDGRWRFALRDMDFSFGRYENQVLPEIYTLADTDTFTRALSNYWSGSYTYDKNSGNYPDSLLIQGLLDFCLRNDSFRARFDAYCRSLVSAENIALLKSCMQDYTDSIENEISFHIERWEGTIDRSYDYENWRKSVADMLSWADERPAYFLSHLENALNHYNKK